jgi:hypothetical protein
MPHQFIIVDMPFSYSHGFNAQCKQILDRFEIENSCHKNRTALQGNGRKYVRCMQVSLVDASELAHRYPKRLSVWT